MYIKIHLYAEELYHDFYKIQSFFYKNTIFFLVIDIPREKYIIII
jgi:hypothetical protein